jgi:hypothetical protein
MWRRCGISVMNFCFKALGRQLSVTPIGAALAFDGSSFARLQVENQRIDFAAVQCAPNAQHGGNAITTLP